jgi:FAD binding domain
MERVPVLIVGGGGAGLTASMLVAGLDVEHLLINSRPGTSELPKAHVLNQRAGDRAVGQRTGRRGTRGPTERPRRLLRRRPSPVFLSGEVGADVAGGLEPLNEHESASSLRKASASSGASKWGQWKSLPTGDPEPRSGAP